MAGEELQEIRVDLRGFEGDREFAVVNTQGRLGSGKNTRRFVQIDNLLSLSSRKEGNQFVVELPSGGSLPVLSRPLDDQLSEYLARFVHPPSGDCVGRKLSHRGHVIWTVHVCLDPKDLRVVGEPCTHDELLLELD